MAFREVTVIEIKEVLRQWLAGASRREIARRVGVDRNTVRSYVRAAEGCGWSAGGGAEQLTEERFGEVLAALDVRPPRGRGEAWALCEEHRDFLKGKLGQRLRLSKVRKLLLRERGADVPYATLHRFATSELDFGRGATTIPVVDGVPGEEMQVDTGWVGSLLPDASGRWRKFRAWIFTSVVSRHRFVYPTFRERTEDAIEACEAAWEYFGGVFRVLLPDNTKSIVAKADPLSPLITPAFLEYAQSRGFVIDPARVRHPKDKARVERAVQSVRDDCFAGERLASLDEARARGRSWSREEYGLRRHTTTGRMPLEMFEAEEKTFLLPAPTEVYEIPLWCSPKVGRDQQAQVAMAFYSLPRQFVGRTLQARADRTTVRFYAGTEMVKLHPRKPRGGRSTDPNDFPPEKAAYAFRDIEFLGQRAESYGAAVGRFARTLLGGPLPWTRMRRVYALLGLAKRYGGVRLDEACARALEADMLDVRRVERMIRDVGPAAPATVSAARVVPLARYLRPPTQYALPFESMTKSSASEEESR
jgi:transposase